MANPQLLTGLGAAFAIFFSAAGSSQASVAGGLVALRARGWRAFCPIIISGVLAIYGLIIAVILAGKMSSEVTSDQGYKYLSSGLAVGLACLSSGYGLSWFITQHMYGVPMPPPPLFGLPLPPRCVGMGEVARPLLDTNESPASSAVNPRPIDITNSYLMVLVFLEAIGLYGLIIALFLSS